MIPSKGRRFSFLRKTAPCRLGIIGVRIFSLWSREAGIMDVREIIADPSLSSEAKVILVTGEIGKHILEAEHEESRKPHFISVSAIEHMTTHELADLLANIVLVLRRL